MLLQELKQPFKYAGEERVGLESREEGEGRKGAPVRGWERVWQREPASRLPACLLPSPALFFFSPFFFFSYFFFSSSLERFLRDVSSLGLAFIVPRTDARPRCPAGPARAPAARGVLGRSFVKRKK